MIDTIEARDVVFHRKRDGWMALDANHCVLGFYSLITVLAWKWFGIGPRRFHQAKISDGEG